MATANVLLPSLVKLHFPDRVGLMTSVYTTSLAVGLTSASVLTVPLSHGARLLAMGPVRLGAHRRASPPSPGSGWSATTASRSPVAADGSRSALSRAPGSGWGMALFFGLQSLQAYSVFGWFAKVYRDAGFSPGTAGLLLGVITAMSIPLSFLLPAWAARMHSQTWLIVGAGRCATRVGYVGLIVAPVGGAWVWAVLVGTGACGVPGGADADRAAGPHQRGHGRAVGVHPVGRLPDLGGGARSAWACSTSSRAAGPCRWWR